MGMPTETILEITPTASSCNIALDVPRRGTIEKMRLIQTAGVLGGFTYTLYSRREAADPDTNLLSSDAEVYRTTPTVTVAGASNGAGAAGVTGFNLNYPYRNQDGELNAAGIARSASMLRRLYLRLTVAGGLGEGSSSSGSDADGDTKAFVLVLGIDEPTGL